MRLLEKSMNSDSVQETASLMLAAHQKTLTAYRWNTRQSGNIQKYNQRMLRYNREGNWPKNPGTMTDTIAEADKWLTRDPELQPLKDHLDAGMQDFMDDIRILSHGIDRGKSGSHEFILNHPRFTQWLTNGASSVLIIVAGSGTGKTIMSALIYNRATKYASSGDMTPVLFHNCRPPRQNTSITILRALISGIISRRSDVVLMDDAPNMEYWTASFANASTFEKLWSIFAQLVRALHEVWIVLDSIHDCSEGLDELLSCLCDLTRDSSVKLKVVFTCREPGLSEVVGNVIEVTPKDLEQGTRDYIQREHPELHQDLIQPALDATCRLGGGPYWAQIVMGLTKAKNDKKAAKAFLVKLRNHAQVGNCIITAVSESRQDLGLALLAILLEATLPLNSTHILQHLRETRFSNWVNVADADIVTDHLTKYFGTVACMKDGSILLPTQEIGDVTIKWARAMIEKKCRESSKAVRQVDGDENHRVNEVEKNEQEEDSKLAQALQFLSKLLPGLFWFRKA